MKLNEKIAWYRREKKLSQEELAARTGVSRQAVSKWELGEASPDVNKLLALAKAFGVTAPEHPEIMAMLRERWGEPNAARRRMAHVPEGGSLVKNPVQGQPGFQKENVFVLAGVPAIMRGRLEDVGPRLRTGAVVLSKTVRVTGTGEGVIAAPLEAVAKAHPAMSLGSYPFFSPPDVYGANLVLRGRDSEELDAAVAELITALTEAGANNIELLATEAK